MGASSTKPLADQSKTKKKSQKSKKFGCFKVKTTIRNGRGGVGAEPYLIVGAIDPIWEDLQENFEKDKATAKEMKEYFNNLFPKENLGNLLFGEFKDFESRVELLDKEMKQSFTDALQTEELIEVETP